jgi:Domain of unknown function (DUF927)
VIQPIDFFAHVLPVDGWYIVCAFQQGREKPNHYMCADLNDLVARVNWCAARGDKVYFAIASYEEKDGIYFEEVKRFKKRCHANVRLLKCLILEIDTQESHDDPRLYKTRAEAKAALVVFCQAHGLPLPTVVSSGGGLHCYWVLTAELELVAWRQLANGLKSACAAHRLQADPVRTADAASVLRPVGTVHRGTGRTVETDRLEPPVDPAIFKPLERYINDRPQNTSVRTGKQRTSGSAILGEVFRPNPSNPRAVFSGCAQLRSLTTQPGRFSEPVHRAAAGAALACGPGGIEHYKSFIEPEWHAIADAKGAEFAANTDGGAPYCTTFEGYNPGGCDGCPYKGPELKSPVELGRYPYVEKILQAKPYNGQEPVAGGPIRNGHACSSIPQSHPSQQIRLDVAALARDHPLPKPFAWGQGGELLYGQEKRNSEELDYTTVSHTPIHLFGISQSETERTYGYNFRQWEPSTCTWRHIPILPSKLFAANGCNELANGGALIRDPGLFLSYVKDAVELQKQVRVDTSYEQSGWKADETEFLVGNELMMPDGAWRPVPVSPDLATRSQLLGPKPGANLGAWNDAATALLKPMGLFPSFLVLSSFGSILMPLLASQEGGSIVSGVSLESGTGKTTTLYVGASVWGQWQAMKMDAIDTQASRGLKFAVQGNLPVFFDEIGLILSQSKPEFVRDLVIMFSNGYDKERAAQHGHGLQYAIKRWSMIMACAGNHWLTEHLEVFNRQSDAPLYRIIEMAMRYPQQHNYADGDAKIAQMFAHAGTAGRAFLAHVVPNIMTVSLRLEQAYKDVWKVTGWGPQHRFHVRTIACNLVAGEILAILGLLNIDHIGACTDVISNLCIRHKTKTPPHVTSAAATAQNAVDVVSEYIDEHSRDVLYIPAWQAGRHIPVHEIRRPMGRLVIRFETDTKMMFTPVKVFREFLVTKGYSHSSVVAELEKQTIVAATRRRICLGAGDMITAPQDCIVFDMGHPAMVLVARELQQQLATGGPNVRA